MKTALDNEKNRIDAAVIGASNGGIESLLAILPNLSPQLPVPIFVVVHVLRDQPSLLADVFRPRCALAVVEAEDKVPIEAGTIYFAPPDYHLLIDTSRQLSLTVDDPVNFSRPSIDVMFESAADVYGGRLMGIILSGANADGAAGLAAIRAAGGITAVQRADTAVSTTMIEAALTRTPGSLALALPEIAPLIAELTASNPQAADKPMTLRTRL